ncbi:MAG TPA: sigma-54 dependent transcriptional regulator [Polyangia bacterium]
MNRILIIDDDEAVLHDLQVFFMQVARYEVRCLSESTRAFEVLAELAPDIVLLDIDMPDISGIDILEYLAGRPGRPEVVILSGVEDIKLAVQAMKLGAYDYLTKPIDCDKLTITIERALERRNLVSEIRELRERTDAGGDEGPFGRVVTRAPQMLEIFKYVELIAPTDNAVLLWGESGTGKELLARAIHRLSRRRDRPFVAVNAGVFAGELFASELFGHARGAFTGAVSDKAGLVEKAHGGTLFLDEIGELPLAVQVKLLRVLQEGEYLRLGATENRHVDVRLITATNKDLREEIGRGSFRADLFYRLNVCNIFVPPLRDREGDVTYLAQYFVEKYARLHGRKLAAVSEDVLALLKRYAYPGNVRELENILNGAVLVETATELTRAALPQYFLEATLRGKPFIARGDRRDPGAERSIAEVEREHIERVLRSTSGNRTAAARILGISRVTLIAKIKQFKLDL